MKQWDKGQQVILTANPDYYGDEPEMKTVTVLFMDEDAAYAAALSGQVDLAYTSAAYSDQTVDGFSLLACKTVDNLSLIHILSATARSRGDTRRFLRNPRQRRSPGSFGKRWVRRQSARQRRSDMRMREPSSSF